MAPLESSVETHENSASCMIASVKDKRGLCMAKESQPSIELKSRKTLLTNFTYVYLRQINTLIVKFRRQTIIEFRQFLHMHHLVGNS